MFLTLTLVGVRRSWRLQAFDPSEWADAVQAFDDDDEEEWIPEQEMPAWLASALKQDRHALDTLSDREAEVLHERYLGGSKRTQMDAALSMGVSSARAGQLEQQARKELTREEAEMELVVALLESKMGYFYFKNDLGLDDARLASVITRYGTVLGQTRETLNAKAETLKKALCLDQDDLRDLVSRQPTLLGFASSSVLTKIDYLTERYRVNAKTLGALCVRAPSLLTYSLHTMKSRYQEDLAYLFHRVPSIAVSKRPALNAQLLNRTTIDKVPELLLVDPEVLRHRLATLPRRAIHRWPRILCTNPWIIERAADVLRRAGVDINVVLSTSPSSCTLSTEKLERQIEFFNQIFDDPVKTARFLTRRPQALGLSVETNLRPTFEWLKHRLNVSSLAPLFDKYPTVVGLAVTNLEPKLDLFQTYNPPDLYELILKRPQLLGYSLENRLKPRLALLCDTHGLTIDDAGKFMSMDEATFTKRIG